MKKETITFISRQDGLCLDGLLVTPDKSPKAVLQIAHGMCEHKERYLPFMEYMAESGYACIINDHRGHGKSVRNPEDLGYFYENGGEALVEDLYQITETMKERFQGLPYFLFGHSMGSMAVRCYTKKYDKAIDGLIVCGCPGENSMAGIGMRIDKFMQKYKGDHARSDVLNEIFARNFEKAFEKEKLQHAWICSDSEVVKRYNEDPLCNFSFTLNGYEALLWLMQNTYSRQGWCMGNPGLPIHFISGDMDPCMINRKKFDEAVEFMRKIGYHNVSSRLYKGMRHEILNEAGRDQVYADVLEFYDGIRNGEV